MKQKEVPTMKMKKLLAILLSLALCTMMLATAALAEEADAVSEEDVLTDEAAYPEEAAYSEEEGASYSQENLRTVEVSLSPEGECIMEDYSVIEIPESAVAVSDEEMDSYLNSIIAYSTTTEFEYEGTAQDGDYVNMDFSGRLADEEEPFDGGTAQGYEIVLGSGAFIPGFEDQVIGHKFGETFDINVTFPEEYAPELAGKEAVFTVTLNYRIVEVVPELTDEFIQEFSAKELDQQLNSLEELKEYTYNYLYDSQLKNAIIGQIQDKITVISYPEEEFNLMKANSLDSLTYYVSMYASYGMEDFDEEAMAQMSGYATAEDYANDEAIYYMNLFMLLDQIAADNGITYTEEEVDEAIAEYMKNYGYDEVYTLDEFKEMSGEAWILMISKLQVEYEKVMDVLKNNVVFVPDQTEGAEDIAQTEEIVEEEAAE